MRLESLSWFTLGGDSLDWCIEAGVDSVEHGIYMNQRQAYELAKRQILYVPTVAVYKLLAEKENPMQVANLFAEHARVAVPAHQKGSGILCKRGCAYDLWHGLLFRSETTLS